jgi:putative transposase
VAWKEEEKHRHNGHTISRLTAHIVLVTKYRYPVLQADIQKRFRDLIKQIFEAKDVIILKGVVSKDHIHMHIEYPPKVSISEIAKAIKGRTSHLIQEQFPELKKRYWGRYFWATGYGIWSTGNITDAMVQKYLEHNQNQNDNLDKTFILESNFISYP